jgi:signal peptidase I
VIGLPGDHIVIKDQQISVKGELFQWTSGHETDQHIYIVEMTGKQEHGIQFSKNRYLYGRDVELVVDKHHYFVMGDHRNYSEDSRVWGLVSEERIMGKVNRILFSVSEQQTFWQSLGEKLAAPESIRHHAYL